MGKKEKQIEKTVLITGASSGIGYEMAEVFAEKGYHLVLISRRIEGLRLLKEQIQRRFNCKVTLLPKDLSKQSAAEEIFEEVMKAGIDVDVVVNNAGTGVCGMFTETELNRDLEMIMLNVASLTALTKLFAAEMVKKKKGKILNVASTGSFQPGPYIAVYYATKAYVLSFTEAIAQELRPYGITVSALCPGATKTEFAQNAGKKDMKTAMSPRTVAEIAYYGMMKGKAVIIPGAANKIGVFISRHLPRGFSARMIAGTQSRLIKEYQDAHPKQ